MIRPVSSQLADFLRLGPTPASSDEVGGSAVNRTVACSNPGRVVSRVRKVSIRCGSSPRGPTISIRVDELFGDNSHKVPPSSLPCHPLTGSDIEYDGLEDPPCARTIGNAIHLVPGLPGTAGDTPLVQAASEAVLLGSLSKRHLDFFKELLPLRLGQTNDQPSEAW